jgi:hemerythrin-like domain-containing protein
MSCRDAGAAAAAPKCAPMKHLNRRHFVRTALAAVATATAADAATTARPTWDDDAGVTAPEDLMKEHGVLNRCLLIYEALLAKDQVSARNTSMDALADAHWFHQTADIIHRFVESYHERNEEKYIFPHFTQHKKLTDLVGVLLNQHIAGRAVTERILRNTTQARFASAADRQKVTDDVTAFIRMYRPHEAREDTVLFPSLRTILPPAEVLAIGQRTEAEEDRILGHKGFEKTLAAVAAIEKQLGIHDLKQFTPTA